MKTRCWTPSLLLLITWLGPSVVPAWCQPAANVPAGGRSLTATGVIQGVEAQQVVSPISAKLLSIVPDGSQVLEGDLLLSFDDTQLHFMLDRQQKATNQAVKAWEIAEEQKRSVQQSHALESSIAAQTIKSALLAKEEMLGANGIHHQEVAAALKREALARAELSLVLQRIERLNESDDADPEEVNQSKLDLIESESKLEECKLALARLKGVTLERRTSEAETAVLRAKADELKTVREQDKLRRSAEDNAATRKKVLDSMKDKLKQIEEQIAACQVFAAQSGVVQHASVGRRVQPAMTKGTTVRAKQPIMSVIRNDRLKLIADVHEAHIGKIKMGELYRVEVDALDKTSVVRGVVDKILLMPDDNRRIRHFSVTVLLQPPHPGLRPGLTAEVTFETDTEK